MFNRSGRRASEQVSNLDFTQLLSNRSAYKFGSIAELGGIGSELTAMTFDPVESLLAIGTEEGRIYIFGKNGVELNWNLTSSSRIKFLCFKSNYLLVLDAKESLTCFDLSRLKDNNQQPFKDSSLFLRSVISCMESSPSLPFLFLGGKDGTVDVFDIDRGSIVTSSRIPNLWLAQEEILRRSGIQDAPSRRHIPACTDIKAHPLNLNLLLIAYEGGVSLWNIAERKVERNWEFVLPPGAPGGGNDEEETLFSERRLNVTCFAWRPDGLLFAVGHEDGCISFACVSDELAITIRTLERADVNKTTEEDLFGWSSQGNDGGGRRTSGRESIFKLTWSGFPEESYLDLARKGWNGSASGGNGNHQQSGVGSIGGESRTHLGGGTILTIMGGLLPQDPIGIHLLEFPPYLPPSTGNSISTSGNIPAPLRQAFKDSITPISHNVYPTKTLPEDFLLLPRESPHYSLAFDPTSIIITTSNDTSLPSLVAKNASRNIEAFSFPITTSIDAKPMLLPGQLNWSGKSSCTGIEIFSIGRFTYQRLTHQLDFGESRIPLNGGKAYSNLRGGGGGGASVPDQGRRTRGESNEPRILVSRHVDLTVRFWDISDHLLLGDEQNEIEEEYPKPLHHLTLDLKDILNKMEATGGGRGLLEANRILKERSWELELVRVQWATESMELAVEFSTGDVILTRFSYGVEHQDVNEYARDAKSNLNDTVENALRDLDIDSNWPTSAHHPSNSSSKDSRYFNPEDSYDIQDRCIDLSHLHFPNLVHLDTFRPSAAFSLSSSSESCIALSDIGFLATTSGSDLMIVDLRGPQVLLYDTPGGAGRNSKGKGKVDSSAITSLTWTIAAIGEDHDRNPRLIVVQASGHTRVFELSQIGNEWHLSSNPISFHHDSLVNTFKTFVVDRFGERILATPNILQTALAHQNNFTRGEDVKGAFTSIWITISPSTINAYFNIDGAKTSTFSDNIGFEKAELVSRQGCLLLVVASKNHTISTFSIPDLVPIHRMSIPAAVHTQAGVVSISSDGDLIQYLTPLSIRLHTIFDFSRPAFPPNLSLNLGRAIPAAPTSKLSSVYSFFGAGERVYDANEIETILGGPSRPPPKLRAPPPPPPVLLSRTTVPPPNASKRPELRENIQEEANSTKSIVERTTEALEMRGEHLNYLSERFNSMANEASEFAANAKKMAQREAGKKALMGGIGSYFK